MSDGNFREKRVFISYSHTDKMAASKISEHLKDSNLKVLFDEWEIGELLSKVVSKRSSCGGFILV